MEVGEMGLGITEWSETGLGETVRGETVISEAGIGETGLSKTIYQRRLFKSKGGGVDNPGMGTGGVGYKQGVHFWRIVGEHDTNKL